MAIEEWPPPLLDYIWRWFLELADWRDCGFGIGPLLHQEIDAWARLFRVDIHACEVDALRQIDRAYRSYHAKKNEKPKASLGEQLASAAADAKTVKSAKGKTKAK